MKRLIFAVGILCAVVARAADAVWVEPAREGNDEIVFTGAFETADAAGTQLRITGATCYRIEVNGKFAGFGPARGPLGYDREETWPLKGVARAGANTIAIRVASYRDNCYSFVNQPPCLRAEVVDADGRILCATGRDFTAKRTNRNCSAKKFTLQRPMREERTLGADETEASVRVVPVAARPNLPRRVPLPAFEVEGMKAEGRDGLFSLARNETGFIGAKIVCETPATVRLTFDEMLVNGDVNPKRFYQGGDVVWHFAKAGTYDVETFDPYTLKYAKFETTAGAAKITDAFLRRYENPMLGCKPRTTGDAELDRIREAAVASFAQNTVDVMTDCPSRERAGWLCDSLFTARAAHHLLGSLDLETLFLENYARAIGFPELPEGMVPMCYPSDVVVNGKGSFIPNWAMFLVLEAEEYMERGGEREIVDALKPRVEGIIAFLSRYENEDGLLENLPGWIFVEWSQANKLVDGVNYPSNMLWAEALAAAGRLCGRADWIEKAAKVRETVRDQSFDGEFFRDHAVRAEDSSLEVRPDRTETCQYYAFYFGVADFTRDAALWERLVKRDFGNLAKSNAFIGNLMRMELLMRDGRRDQMRDEIKRYYLKMADATGTLWEHDSTRASCCHAFSSFLTVLLDGDESDDLAADTARVKAHICKDLRGMFREPSGNALKFPYLTPGSAKYAAVLWDWDSWLSDIALRQILSDAGTAADRADAVRHERGCILNYLAYTDETDGFMPIVISSTSDPSRLKPSDWQTTNMHKPCLAQHAAFLVREADGDAEWLRDSFARLEAFIANYRERRRHAETGLYIWQDDLAIGVDNDPSTFFRPKNSSASIFLNSMMYKELRAMAYLAERLGKGDRAALYAREAATLGEAVRTWCWDEKDAMFYSCDVNLLPFSEKPREIFGGSMVLHKGAPRDWSCLVQRIGCWSGWMALWAGIATPEQARKMVAANLTDGWEFLSPYGIRTLSKKEKMYNVRGTNNPSNWLGPVWGVSCYMTWRGLADYGFDEEARKVAEATLRLYGEDLAANGALHEYYDPDTGKGIINKGFQNWNYLALNMIAWLEGRREIREF